MVKKWKTYISQVKSKGVEADALARCICLPAIPGISGLCLATFQVSHNHNSVEICFP